MIQKQRLPLPCSELSSWFLESYLLFWPVATRQLQKTSKLLHFQPFSPPSPLAPSRTTPSTFSGCFEQIIEGWAVQLLICKGKYLYPFKSNSFHNPQQHCSVLKSEYSLFTERGIASEITQSGQKERQSRDKTQHKRVKLSQPGQQRKLAPKPGTVS